MPPRLPPADASASDPAIAESPPPAKTKAAPRTGAALLGLLVGVTALLLVLAHLRVVGGYGVETDFYGRFVSEARCLLTGQPLLVDAHPPFYAILLASIYSLDGDWFHAGLMISVVSGVIALFSAYHLFAKLLGRPYGIAAAVALLLWPDFLRYSVTAGTDMVFVALMLAALATASGASREFVLRGLIAGVLAALAALTRTNGVILILLPIFYAVQFPSGRRWVAAASVAGGFLLPWGAWAVMSQVTGSQFFPHRNYVDVAVHFYGAEDGTYSSNSDNRAAVEERFSSIGEVIAEDPVKVFTGVARNSISHGLRLFRHISPLLLPLGAMGILGCLALLFLRRQTALWALALIFAAQYGTLCLRSFDSRLYLFLIPLVGAGIVGLLVGIGQRFPGFERLRPAVTGILVVACCGFLGLKSLRGYQKLRSSEATDALEAAAVLSEMKATGRIIARKPHLGFLTDLAHVQFPQAESFEELKAALSPSGERPRTLLSIGPRTFLFFGDAEAVNRPEIKSLQSGTEVPEWLSPIGRSQSGEFNWRLYEVRLND